MKTILLGLAAAGLVAGATVELSHHNHTTAESSAPVFAGRYVYQTISNSPATKFSTTWTVTPCGNDCVHITTASGLTDTDAHLEGSTWKFSKFDEAGIMCDNHKVLPATVQFSINPDSLQGMLQPQGDPCGGASRATAFTLTKQT